LKVVEFCVNRFCMKLFLTNNITVVKSCQPYFSFDLPSALLERRATNLILNTKHRVCVIVCLLNLRSLFIVCIFSIVYAFLWTNKDVYEATRANVQRSLSGHTVD